MQRIRPAFQVLVPLAIGVWAWMSLTILFGPDDWYSSDQLHYVRMIPEGVWGTSCGAVAIGLSLGALGRSWEVMRLAFALAVFLATGRCLLLAMTIPAEMADNVATIPAWAFLATTHIVIAREPFTTTT